MEAAFSGWMQNMTFEVITQVVGDDGFVTDQTTVYSFKGTFQPLSAEEIQLKPDGQRSWEWAQIHVKSGSVVLSTNDRFIYNGKTFKVMGVKDYSLNNYVEYHVIADYE